MFAQGRDCYARTNARAADAVGYELAARDLLLDRDVGQDGVTRTEFHQLLGQRHAVDFARDAIAPIWICKPSTMPWYRAGSRRF